MLINSPAAGREIPQSLSGLGDPCAEILAGTMTPQGMVTGATNPSIVSACFCSTFPWACSTATNQASQALLHPDLVYGTGQSIQVAPSAPAFAYSTAPPPDNAMDLAQQQSNLQIAANQGYAQQYMDQISQNAQAAGDSGLGLSITAWIGIAAVGLLAIGLLKK